MIRIPQMVVSSSFLRYDFGVLYAVHLLIINVTRLTDQEMSVMICSHGGWLKIPCLEKNRSCRCLQLSGTSFLNLVSWPVSIASHMTSPMLASIWGLAVEK